ncbi:F-box only protein 24 [Alligator mississippiensis]|uniref:F-box only protein 24 isoform B n=1 Tax=Alligator mississippiensis TaxID=8496 RepID=A0A151M8W0_ALLMI|nr:F-box only protein 24 [Alligator mississippiensis]KYO20880.1 F-box only protein 24 isoform B [Alligator mississippiensis]
MDDQQAAQRLQRRRQGLRHLAHLALNEAGLRSKRPPHSPGDKKGPAEAASIQSLPPELLEHIMSFLPVSAAVALGQTCHTLYCVCNSEGAWRRACRRLCALPPLALPGARPWKRAAVLNYTKGLVVQPFGGRQRGPSRPPAPALAHGYRKLVPTREHVLVLDHAGTLFSLRHALTPAPGPWRRAARYAVLCRGAKDFTTDPRSDAACRKYIYVLATRAGGDGGPTPDCVEVYLQGSGQRIFKMTFHPALRFRQLRLLGPETARALLLLTEDGRVYSLSVDESQLAQPRSYTVQLALRKVSRGHPGTPIAAIAAAPHSAAFLTEQGTVYLEVHAPGVYRDLFGTLHAYDPHDPQMPLVLSLPAKVLSCALGSNHLGLVDEFGRVFMQGSNRHGQLGTGDKIDRGEPAQVPSLARPLALWCGLNHSVVLAPSGAGGREVLGCGCGAGGRLPGWPKGSASFVCLQVEVPPSASSLCSTRDGLYVLCSYDIEEQPAFRDLPPGAPAEPPVPGPGVPPACTALLVQLQSCPTLPGRVAKLQEAVDALPLPPAQRHFLCQGLELVQRAAQAPPCS